MRFILYQEAGSLCKVSCCKHPVRGSIKPSTTLMRRCHVPVNLYNNRRLRYKSPERAALKNGISIFAALETDGDTLKGDSIRILY